MSEPEAADDEAADPSQGVYGISVVSGLVGTGVQNLRAYERAGLLYPDRTAGGTRLYSPDDVARLRRIQRLLGDGLNLAGVGRVLDLEDDVADLRQQLERRDEPGS
jgi:DNA-binding transcriptional MerR regulator